MKKEKRNHANSVIFWYTTRSKMAMKVDRMRNTIIDNNVITPIPSTSFTRPLGIRINEYYISYVKI